LTRHEGQGHLAVKREAIERVLPAFVLYSACAFPGISPPNATSARQVLHSCATKQKAKILNQDGMLQNTEVTDFYPCPSNHEKAQVTLR
jgi:hypothetical protein